MIGVAVRGTDIETVKEFFELFKTPWEFVVAGRSYPVVLSTVGRPADVGTGLLIAYGRTESGIDREAEFALTRADGFQLAQWKGSSLPLYRGAAGFAAAKALTLESGGQALDYRVSLRAGDVWRVGYDLFDELRYLVTEGQPPSYALTPTLELHISLLRHLLLESGVPFLEVPARPSGCEFICCLTHDVDFFGIRRHPFDRTLAGFVARASIGTLVEFVRGERPFAEALRNWLALFTLPLVFLRMLPDFWRPIEDYAMADGPRPSTFFVVPFRDRPGVGPDGGVETTRAVRYQASEVAELLKEAADQGNELAVHGIDAWRDSNAGRAELNQITTLTNRPTAGVRMHWLYFDREAPEHLKAAGFDYDSTYGYNDAVGYRAGTSQVFQLPGTASLLELPLTIMDSALFYPSRMGLGRDEALVLCRRLLANAQRYGGTLVINWHERSLAPERQWGDVYRRLLDELDQAGTWFATASEAINWFRWRRSITFDIVHRSSEVRVRVSTPSTSPRGATVRVFRSGAHRKSEVTESPYNGSAILELDFPLPPDRGDRRPQSAAQAP